MTRNPHGHTARGYDRRHKALRARWDRKVKAGGVICWRCHDPIHPNSEWDLGHDDHDRSQYRGPEHQYCNRAAGGRIGAERLHRTSPSAPALDFFNTSTDTGGEPMESFGA